MNTNQRTSAPRPTTAAVRCGVDARDHFEDFIIPSQMQYRALTKDENRSKPSPEPMRPFPNTFRSKLSKSTSECFRFSSSEIRKPVSSTVATARCVRACRKVDGFNVSSCRSCASFQQWQDALFDSELL